jgi:IclR family pca regulon transcriptional regulator
LRARTARTVTSATQLRKTIQADREKGWSMVNQELEEGLCSLSVPLRGRSGTVIAALNVSSQVSRTPPQAMAKRFLPALREAADKINAALRLRI